MALQPAIEGGRHTPQTITFARADDATQNLTGATLSGTIRNIRTGVERAISVCSTATSPVVWHTGRTSMVLP